MIGFDLRTIVRRAPSWILLIAALSLALGQLNRPERLPLLWPAWAEIGALALGMTAIMISGGIDLSIGSIIALSGMVIGVTWRDAGAPIAVAAMAGVGAGLLAGGGNAALIALGVAPLVATLATMALYAGLAMALSGGERITRFPTELTSWGSTSWLGLPAAVWLLIGAAIVMGALTHATPFGRLLFAIGDNRLAARFTGAPVKRIEAALYTLNGLLAGIVAVLYTASRGAAIPDAGEGIELKAIGCVVLGGTPVTGGAGGIGRTLLGVAVVAHLDIGLQLLGARRFHLPGFVQPIQLDAQFRLIALGVLLLAMAIWNERTRVRA